MAAGVEAMSGPYAEGGPMTEATTVLLDVSA
jgi:hypothetical protein